ncbi:MAG: hypothetical protein Q9223_002664, partial [Gallowayella weberi]
MFFITWDLQLTQSCSKRYSAMFDILEADIVVFQETKIQRKDLVDDMVLVPGWDCYWSLPKHKKEASPIDATTLDSEGRCVILEFPAFVLFGVYSPANRDETRDEFRLGFLNVLDARIRNLVAIGKRVIVTGDLNISREELDTANAEASMRKNGYTIEEYISTPARRMFNQLLEGGRVIGKRDQGREKAIMWDACRGFHPKRKGMFTCWEQKVNARPGNYGARIDYVLSSIDMKAWFSDCNIQEGLMGSDHCPVFAVIKDQVDVNGVMVHTLDMMNPQGMFSNGVRQREYSTSDMLPSSGRLIPEFDGRRNIKDMFTRKPALAKKTSTATSSTNREHENEKAEEIIHAIIGHSPEIESPKPIPRPGQDAVPSVAGKKRPSTASSTNRPFKRSKSGTSMAAIRTNTKGQQSLKGFFKSMAAANDSPAAESQTGSFSNSSFEAAPEISLASAALPTKISQAKSLSATSSTTPVASQGRSSNGNRSAHGSPSQDGGATEDWDVVHDPIESKESWSKLFTKPAAPRCEGHDEPCKTMLTKKSGMNCGRSFWMCARPLGPSGAKEKNTQWR